MMTKAVPTHVHLFARGDVSAAPCWLRGALIAVGLAAWFGTQSLIGQRPLPESGVGDAVHRWTAPVHDALLVHPAAADALLIVSSAVIDALGVWLLVVSLFGRTIRPFLGLLMLFALRQVCQALCALPAPPGMIWHATGVPTLLVTYGVAGDFFFSGHTGLAVLGAVELARTGRRGLAILGVLVALFEATAVLVLRAHYTMDVFAGAITALLVAELAARWAPGFDRFLARLGELGRAPAGGKPR
jgi:PAP2 superfamily C-terminal